MLGGQRLAVALVVLCAVTAGCAKAPQQRTLDVTKPAVNAYQAIDTQTTTASIAEVSFPILEQPMPLRVFSGNLSGRTLAVAAQDEIILRPGEVILTFDDGPRPGKTDAVLETLETFGVGATFMMLGKAAEDHPELVREVALRGHTIGTHTYDHANLTGLSSAEAMQEIAAGEAAVRTALAEIGREPSPFFRFPYLAQTGFLRTSLNQSNVIVLDVDIDSKDYYPDSAETVLERTLTRLDARGNGIILFHDIHARTIAMLPKFLEALDERGYSVVRLQAKHSGDIPLIMAERAAPQSSITDLE